MFYQNKNMAKYAKKRSSVKSTKTTARKIVKATKMLMLKSVETKYYCFGYGFSLANNDIYSFSPTQQIGVGNTAITRVGDSILLQGLTTHCTINVDPAVLNAKFRILVGFTRNQTANTTVGTNVIGQSELFFAPNVATTIPNTHRIVNPAIFTSLYDEIVDINSNTTTGQDIKTVYSALYMGLKKFNYAAVGGSLGKTNNLVFCIMCNSPNNAYGTVLGEVFGNTMLRFKDP